MKKLVKQTLGGLFSEGARRLWLSAAKSRRSQTDLANALGTSTSQVSRWLYGERRPSLTWAFAIQDKLKIPAVLWQRPPAEPFRPPAAKASVAAEAEA